MSDIIPYMQLHLGLIRLQQYEMCVEVLSSLH